MLFILNSFSLDDVSSAGQCIHREKSASFSSSNSYDTKIYTLKTIILLNSKCR
ncbi:hypothetical protein [Cytobacillus oceanisediminis]|uniref:hypothetical protein n=1 Tax=Cytobacillus oceanisediminis TaxID=665099 RepID=UPI001C23CDB3|nr:hypothetical protein [Cytobacillus oceanisediminis]MBU8770505.1 hypothetical protein [Cytobacillus oceanisediminis]